MPNRIIDLTGMRFGNLVVMGRYQSNDKRGKPLWVCNCDCGNTSIVRGDVLRRGDTKTCGHKCRFNGYIPDKKPSEQTMRKRRYDIPVTANSARYSLYRKWCDMKLRCQGRCTQPQYYGDKGISYDPAWEDFDVFSKWALENGYKRGLEIDRIDGDKGYSPENCRWVSHKDNSRNRKARSNNTTGVAGVHERKKTSGEIVYRASIATDNGKIYLGTFKTIDEAAKARREAELKYWGFNIGE